MPTDSKIPGWEAFLREIKSVLEQYHSLDKEIAILRTEQRKDVKAQEDALVLQKAENDKHFADLNHEYKRIDDVRNTMVNQPVYNAERADILQRLNILTTFKDNYEGKQSQIMRNTIVISIIVPLIVSLVLIIISHYWH